MNIVSAARPARSARRASGHRITEAEIADAVEAALADMPKGEASFAELFEIVPQYVNLSRADLAQSKSRPSEQLWVQQVRNIVAHQGSEGNAIYEGRLKQIPAGIALVRRRRR